MARKIFKKTAPRSKLKMGDSVSDIMVRNDILKLLYAGMLLEIPLNKVREFWLNHPLPNKKEANDPGMVFHKIWQEKDHTSLKYCINVLNDVEPFLLSNGINPVEFITDSFYKINRGMLISAQSLLQWGKPYLSLFFVEKDLRALILRLLNYFSQRLTSEVFHKVIKHDSEEKWNSATILIMQAQPQKILKLQRMVYEKKFLPYDCELWTGMLVQSIPYCMNLPPFEELRMISDCRTVEQIIPDLPVVVKNSSLLINGGSYGKILSFNDFALKVPLDLIKYNIPSQPVVVMEKDYYCPERKRVILHTGCAYGAPVYLYNLRYIRGVKKPDEFMSSIIDEATDNLKSSWAEVHAIHQTMLETVTNEANIIYYNAEESISINGKHLIKFVPAKIFRKMLIAYLSKGQTLFEHREFIRDKEIICDPLNPNLHIRIRRLKDTLNKGFPAISIINEARGRIRFQVGSKISYKEY